MGEAKHQHFKVTLPKGYEDAPDEVKQAIAIEIMDRIRERTTQENVDKNGKDFPKYTKGYEDSRGFAAANKSSNVDLELSGDMLTAMQLLQASGRKLDIGYEDGTLENAKADGNIRGTYGKPRADRSKARDFLGISKNELDAILEKYPLDDEQAMQQNADSIVAAAQAAEDISMGGGEEQ